MSKLIKMTFIPAHNDARPYDFLRNVRHIAMGAGDRESVTLYVEESDFGRFLDNLPPAPNYGMKYQSKHTKTKKG